MNSAAYWIEKLGLQKHPEGGWFAEVYRSEQVITVASLTGQRNFSTSIYFLLEGNDFSTFHRIKSDELWHFYSGCSVTIYAINKQGELTVHKIGDGNSFQTVIKGGEWFAARPEDEKQFSLVGCTVSPGFDFVDFEMAKRPDLLQQFPQHSQLIKEFTRED